MQATGLVHLLSGGHASWIPHGSRPRMLDLMTLNRRKNAHGKQSMAAPTLFLFTFAC